MTNFNHNKVYSPVNLDSKWSLHISRLYRQSDHVITRLHYHHYLELGYCYEGSGIFVIGDQIYHFQKGAIIYIPAYEKHLAQSIKGTESQWRFITLDRLKLPNQTPHLQLNVTIGNHSPNATLLNESENSEVSNHMKQMIELLINPKNHYKEKFILKLHELEIILQEGQKNDSINTYSKEYERILPAIEFICHNYQNKITLEELSSMCNLSLAQFRRVFIKAVQKSPQDYINTIRMNMCLTYLKNTDKSILDIAILCGFNTLSSFNRMFLKAFHKTPKEIRKTEKL